MIRIAYIETLEDGTQRTAERFVVEEDAESVLKELRMEYPIVCIERWI